MIVWRISNHTALDGAGGLRAAGRWHSRGSRIVYAADHPATAMLEILVHLEIDPEDLPASYRLLRIEAPDDMAAPAVSELPPDWRERTGATRALGDTWLRGTGSAMLRVPSAIVPHATNILINPAHPEAARVAVAAVEEHPFDPRLFGAGG